MLPTTDFFGHPVTRLMIGGNPFGGHTYIPWVSREEMLDYYTADTVVKTLFRAEALGYNTALLLGDDFTLRVWRQYRQQGGTMKWIAQTHPPLLLETNLVNIMEYDPIAIFHQGTMTDNLMEEGHQDQLQKNLDAIQSTGKPYGMATHVPETVLKAEEEGWGPDFYMTCLHNMRKRDKYQSSFITGVRRQHEFFAEDRQAMFDVIASVDKPCIAFKILSGGHMAREDDGIYRAVEETFAKIKPSDLTVVGVFQKYRDELQQNAEIVQKVLGAVPR